MDASLRGLPLLSGPPPEFHTIDRFENSCRKCNKEFNLLFSRGRRCNHCGYLYCHSCSDYQALMPRSTPDSGYEKKSVCGFCIQYLNMTASGKTHLRDMPLSKLKNYMQAYNIRMSADLIEKDDIVDRIIAARGPNGCLPPYHENHYRKYAVPNGQSSRPRGFFSRQERTFPSQNLDPRSGWRQTNSFTRPDLHQDQQRDSGQSARYGPPPGPPPGFMPNTSNFFTTNNPNSSPPNVYTSSGSSSSSNRNPFNPFGSSNSANQNETTNRHENSNENTTSRPSRPTNSHPEVQVPSLEDLLEMDEETIGTLSIGTLKSILEKNHVGARLILEKGELVARVRTLISSEREERTHNAAMREREEWEAQERIWEMREREKAQRAQRDQEGSTQQKETFRNTVESVDEDDLSDDIPLANPPPPSSSSDSVNAETSDSATKQGDSKAPATEPPRPHQERSGLCVVCQDEDANIVIVDCGHLALCRACSKLIWDSTRECPLCRTRIVTESRLLRIFKA